MKRLQNNLKVGISHNAQFISLVSAKGGRCRLKFYVLDDENRQTESIATNETFSLEQIEESIFGGRKWEACRNSQWSVALGRNDWNGCLTVLSFSKAEFAYPAWFQQLQEEWQGCRNGEEPSEAKKAYLEERRAKDPRFARIERIRQFQRKAINGEIADDVCLKWLGADCQTIRAHVASTFADGMSWKNRQSFEIDHIKPLSRFDVFDRKELLAALNYKNLQALTPEENRKKYAN